MWDGPNIAANIVAAAALLWAIVSSFIACGTQRQAADAEARAAAALEKANELNERILNPPPTWTLTPSGPPGVWNLTNRTGHHATAVYVESVDGAFREADATTSIPSNTIWGLQALEAFHTATVTVRWTDPTGDMPPAPHHGPRKAPSTCSSPQAPQQSFDRPRATLIPWPLARRFSA